MERKKNDENILLMDSYSYNFFLNNKKERKRERKKERKLGEQNDQGEKLVSKTDVMSMSGVAYLYEYKRKF